MEAAAERKMGAAALLALVVFAVVADVSVGLKVCKVTVDQLNICKKEVTPPVPATPSKACCAVLAAADLNCLCSYKDFLHSLGINSTLALQLPSKCELKNIPQC